MLEDFGPVPVSQLKSESPNVFAALDAGRRVLLSRHGRVVAAIEPARVEDYASELARFAVADPRQLRELSATTISQRSPAEFVRDAESGVASYVTRDHRVYGLLTGLSSTGGGGPDEQDLEQVSEQERALAEFERDHPNASAEEFAAAVARSTSAGSAAEPENRADLSDVDLGDPGASSVSDEDLTTLVEAIFVKSQALQSVRANGAALPTFVELAAQQGLTEPVAMRSRVVRTMVALGRGYLDSDPERAVELVDTAIDWISATGLGQVGDRGRVPVMVRRKRTTV